VDDERRIEAPHGALGFLWCPCRRLLTVRVLVTGASGFVGRHLVAHLALWHDVLAPTHADLDLAQWTATREFLARTSPDVVVHCAVKPGHRNAVDRTGLLEANLSMFFNLVRSRERYGRLVVISSGAVYDVRQSLEMVSEESFGRHVPVDEHGASKFAEALWLRNDTDAVELRVFGVYGPGEDYAIRFISNACCKALFDMPITLQQDRRFSYVWVEDLGLIVQHFLERGQPGAYNVTPNEAYSLRTLAETVLHISGKQLPVLVGTAEKGLAYTGSNKRLVAEMGAPRLTPMELGIRRLYEWYQERRAAIRPEALAVDK
jgi:UDP-glucose 4-epimerase